MTFLNWAMLAGLAGVAIPILIHLLNRQKAHLVDWGAMKFLLDSLTSRNHRILIEEIILLAIRCLVVVLLVLALARPFLPASSIIPWPVVLPAVIVAALCAGVAAAVWRSARLRTVLLGVAGGLVVLALVASLVEQGLQSREWSLRGGQRDVAVIVDGSDSMHLVVGGRTNFSRAVDEARAVIAQLLPADAVSLIVAGPVPERAVAGPTADREVLAAALDELKPLGGPMGTLEALNEAVAVLAEGSNPAKLVVLVTDGQRLGWDPGNDARWRFLTAGLEGLSTEPQLMVRTLRLPDRFHNAAAGDLTFSRGVVGTDRPVRATVQVLNTGTTAVQPAGVRLLVDGVEIDRKLVGRIDAGVATAVDFVHRFDAAGAHVVRAEVVSDDDLPTDNAVTRSLRVVDRLPVLLVDGRPSPRPLDGAADFVDVALTPLDARTRARLSGKGEGEAPAPAPGSAQDEIGMLVAPEVVKAEAILSVKDFTPYAVVVLADVAALPATVAAQLADYVAHGGGLLVLPGDQADPAFYEGWRLVSGRGVVPGRLVKRARREAAPARLATKTLSHPALALLAEGAKTDARDALVQAHWQVAVNDQEAGVRVGGLLDTGDPLLVERRLGQGTVLLLPLCLDRRDSNLPSLKCFVPLVHELAYYLARPMVGRVNVPPGEKMALVLHRGTAEGLVGNGLRGEYYDGTDFKRLRLTRTDPTVHFTWNDRPPDRRLGSENYSVRWTGRVRPRHTETYTFHTVSDDGVRLWVGDKQLINDWNDHAPEQRRGTLDLEADRTYPIRLEFYQGSGAAEVTLFWSSRSQPKEVIPASRLYSKDVAVPRRRNDAFGIQVATPTGAREPATATPGPDGLALGFEGTRQPGLYRFIVPPEVQQQYGPVASSDGTLPFVVTGDPQESRLAALTPADLAAIGDRVDLFRAETTDQLTAAVAGQVPGEELWRYLAVGLLAALLAEIALARWIAVKRQAHALEPVRFGDEVIDARAVREQTRAILSREPREALEGAGTR